MSCLSNCRRLCLPKTEHFPHNGEKQRVQMTTLPSPLVFSCVSHCLLITFGLKKKAFSSRGGRRTSLFNCKTTSRVSLSLRQRQRQMFAGNLLETLQLPAKRIHSPLQRRLSVSLIKNICLDDTAVSPAECGRVICTRKSGEEQNICDGLFRFSSA